MATKEIERLKAKGKNIYQRIAAAMRVAKYVEKKTRSQAGYNYVSEGDIIALVRPALLDEGVVVVASVIESGFEFRQNPKDSAKAVVFATVKTRLRFVNIDKPDDRVELFAVGHGADLRDKAVSIATTYAYKAGLRQGVMMLETGDDAEKYDYEAPPNPPERDYTPEAPSRSQRRRHAQTHEAPREPATERQSAPSQAPRDAEQGMVGFAGDLREVLDMNKMPAFAGKMTWRSMGKDEIAEQVLDYRENMGGHSGDGIKPGTMTKAVLVATAKTHEYRAQCYRVLVRMAISSGLDEGAVRASFHEESPLPPWKCSDAEFESGFMLFLEDVKDKLELRSGGA